MMFAHGCPWVPEQDHEVDLVLHNHCTDLPLTCEWTTPVLVTGQSRSCTPKYLLWCTSRVPCGGHKALLDRAHSTVGPMFLLSCALSAMRFSSSIGSSRWVIGISILLPMVV